MKGADIVSGPRWLRFAVVTWQLHFVEGCGSLPQDVLVQWLPDHQSLDRSIAEGLDCPYTQSRINHNHMNHMSLLSKQIWITSYPRYPTTASMNLCTGDLTCFTPRPAREHHRLSSVWGTSCRTPFRGSANIGAQRDPNNLGLKGLGQVEMWLKSFQISSHLGKWPIDAGYL